MIKEMQKLSLKLLTVLRTDKNIHWNQNLAQAYRFIQKDYPEFEDEFEVQIMQYGPDTTIGALVNMARYEKPEPITFNCIKNWFYNIW